MAADDEGVAPANSAAGQAARRRANGRRAGAAATPTDAQGLVEFACECMASDCERSVRIPLHVYRRMLEATDQYLVQRGHHAFARNRTIVTLGLVHIEERRA
ncbi:MAG: hypothetical protein OEW31_05280 [Thermoleophilia bacterium]|nr:hypothetical protein [Thermoleophilia bacterium]MDH4345727.1 hypothetical protein [Thermoleophilia bacterium]MDH5333322.1 hypothetical protein [Thermoleophilia bacterium]